MVAQSFICRAWQVTYTPTRQLFTRQLICFGPGRSLVPETIIVQGVSTVLRLSRPKAGLYLGVRRLLFLFPTFGNRQNARYQTIPNYIWVGLYEPLNS